MWPTCDNAKTQIILDRRSTGTTQQFIQSHQVKYMTPILEQKHMQPKKPTSPTTDTQGLQAFLVTSRVVHIRKLDA